MQKQNWYCPLWPLDYHTCRVQYMLEKCAVKSCYTIKIKQGNFHFMPVSTWEFAFSLCLFQKVFTILMGSVWICVEAWWQWRMYPLPEVLLQILKINQFIHVLFCNNSFCIYLEDWYVINLCCDHYNHDNTLINDFVLGKRVLMYWEIWGK